MRRHWLRTTFGTMMVIVLPSISCIFSEHWCCTCEICPPDACRAGDCPVSTSGLVQRRAQAVLHGLFVAIRNRILGPDHGVYSAGTNVRPTPQEWSNAPCVRVYQTSLGLQMKRSDILDDVQAPPEANSSSFLNCNGGIQRLHIAVWYGLYLCI